MTNALGTLPPYSPPSITEQSICQITCIEHSTFTRSRRVCRSRRSGCSGDDQRCCNNWDDVLTCYDSYSYWFHNAIDENLSASSSWCSSSDKSAAHSLEPVDVDRGEVAASCSELGTPDNYGYGDPEWAEGDALTCWIPDPGASEGRKTSDAQGLYVLPTPLPFLTPSNTLPLRRPHVLPLLRDGRV